MRLVKIVVLLLAISGTVAAEVDTSAYDLVKQTSDRMINALKNRGDELHKNPQLIYDLVDQIVLPHFDFEHMSQLVLGKYWNRISADEKKQFIAEFKLLLVRTYGTAMSDYSEQRINFLPFRNDSNADDVTVKTEVEQKGGFPIPIDYSLSKKQGEWKVYDVSIDSVSLVVNYRTSFASEIKQSGIAELIKKLRTRNEQDLNPGGA
jgi:phospholipid transport system substrate-binding protein